LPLSGGSVAPLAGSPLIGSLPISLSLSVWDSRGCLRILAVAAGFGQGPGDCPPCLLGLMGLRFAHPTQTISVRVANMSAAQAAKERRPSSVSEKAIGPPARPAAPGSG